MKKFFIYTIMCFLYITLTATTCEDDGTSVTHRVCTFTNESGGEVYLVVLRIVGVGMDSAYHSRITIKFNIAHSLITLYV
jgi:hypothetical protein